MPVLESHPDIAALSQLDIWSWDAEKLAPNDEAWAKVVSDLHDSIAVSAPKYASGEYWKPFARAFTDALVQLPSADAIPRFQRGLRDLPVDEKSVGFLRECLAESVLAIPARDEATYAVNGKLFDALDAMTGPMSSMHHLPDRLQLALAKKMVGIGLANFVGVCFPIAQTEFCYMTSRDDDGTYRFERPSMARLANVKAVTQWLQVFELAHAQRPSAFLFAAPEAAAQIRERLQEVLDEIRSAAAPGFYEAR